VQSDELTGVRTIPALRFGVPFSADLTNVCKTVWPMSLHLFVSNGKTICKNKTSLQLTNG
jgi:hypothetical protein